MGFVVSTQQEKGGVAKTTSSTNLAAALALAGHPTCLIDFDPGAADSRIVGGDVPEDQPTVESALKSGDLTGAICPTRTENLYLLPGDPTTKPRNFDDEDLAQLLLAQALESVADRFDFFIVDVKGGLDLMGQMAMYAADLVIVPCDRDGETVEKAQKTLNYAATVAQKRNRIGRPVSNPESFARLLLSKWVEGRKASSDLEEGLEGLPESAMFKTRIFAAEPIQAARNAGQTIFEYHDGLRSWKRSASLKRALAQFSELGKEVMEHGREENSDTVAFAANS